jgi:hypothetical protein
MTPSAVRINTFHDAWLTIHIRYGELYLDRREYHRRLVTRLGRYAEFLAKAVIQTKFRDPRFRKHHRTALGRLFRSLTSNRSKEAEPPPRSRADNGRKIPSRAGADAVERD